MLIHAFFFLLVDKRELLEIAKANAAKALGTDNIVLPASLKFLAPSKERKNDEQEAEDAGESTEVSMNWSVLHYKVNASENLSSVWMC